MKYLKFYSIITVAILCSFTIAAQVDTQRVAMNYSMAKDPGYTNTSANISMFPNPAKGSVNLYLNTLQAGDRGECAVYNANGNLYARQAVKNGTNTIYLKNAPAGIYFLRIMLHSEVILTRKLVVIR